MGKKPDPRQMIIPTCYWWHNAETGEWIIIPGCMARAQDPNACSCHIPESRIERERAKRRAAEATIDRIRKKWRLEGEERREMAWSLKQCWKVMRDHGLDPSAIGRAT